MVTAACRGCSNSHLTCLVSFLYLYPGKSHCKYSYFARVLYFNKHFSKYWFNYVLHKKVILAFQESLSKAFFAAVFNDHILLRLNNLQKQQVLNSFFLLYEKAWENKQISNVLHILYSLLLEKFLLHNGTFAIYFTIICASCCRY